MADVVQHRQMSYPPLWSHKQKFNYHLNNAPMQVVEVEKDLGVQISVTATPSSQVAAAAKKANSVLGQLMRGFSYRDTVTFKRLYLQYVRPLLEYAVQA